MRTAWIHRTAEASARLASRKAAGITLLAGDAGHWALWEEGQVRELPAAEARALNPSLAPLLDHTLLKAGATGAEVETLCREARAHAFASVCVNPVWVPWASAALTGTAARVCTVVGFPLGATATAAKAFEAEQALRDGADEVDMVLDLGAARSGEWAQVQADLRALRRAVPRPKVLKVILETCLLDEAQKRRACALAAEEGLDFVKTSTGFSTGGATVEDVALMRAVVGESVGVKASGGIRTYDQALAMVLAGATRLGVSASLAILQGGSGAGQNAGTGY